MKYLSVCSGIEAATVAWHGLGWQPVAFSEIEKFPSAVLAHHYPTVPNLGDMTNYKEWNIGQIDLLVGGTPCQSFSVAGLRKGLDDPRGNLCLVYLGLAARFQPRWILWENVPGVLSSGGGRDFGSFLGALAQLGYGFAYRVLDAQYFGVPQRRRRVFVVGHLGDWRRAAAVLFESHSLQGHPAPSRKKGEEVAGSLASSSKSSGGIRYSNQELFSQRGDSLITEDDFVCHTLSPTVTNGPPFSRTGNERVECEALVLMDQGGSVMNVERRLCRTLRRETHGHEPIVCMAHGQANAEISSERSPALTCNHEAPIICHGTQDPCIGDIAFALGRNTGQENAVCQVQWASGGGKLENPTMQALRAGAEHNYQFLRTGMQVRRFTPTECERLQGFPDDYTNIPWRNKPEAPDGPRYKALGNSMAVPCMKWLGERLQMVDNI